MFNTVKVPDAVLKTLYAAAIGGEGHQVDGSCPGNGVAAGARSVDCPLCRALLVVEYVATAAGQPGYQRAAAPHAAGVSTVRLIAVACAEGLRALEAPRGRNDDWLVLDDEFAATAVACMHLAWQAIHECSGCDAQVISLFDRALNCFEYCRATITPRLSSEPAEAHAGRAGSAARQMRSLRRRADDLLASFESNQAVPATT